jgi:hypothetical protein
MKRNLLGVSLAIAMAAMGVSSFAGNSDMTAFQLVKEGNHSIGEQARDQVVEIRSDKSVGSLTPVIWYIVYYDPDASHHTTEIKFGAGTKLLVKHPMRIFDDKNKLDNAKLNVDSDKAINIAKKEPLLANLTLKATQLKLERSDDGPVWRVRLWCAKLKDPNDDADVGTVTIAAESGKVIKSDLHIDSVAGDAGNTTNTNTSPHH